MAHPATVISEQYFRGRTRRCGECLIWTGTRTHGGYGTLSIKGKQFKAHRIAYQFFIGELPPHTPTGPQLDHLCRTRLCVNPAHLRLVAQRENVLAEHSQSPSNLCRLKTHCANGHQFSPETTVWRPSESAQKTLKRACRICERARSRASYRRVKPRRAAEGLCSDCPQPRVVGKTSCAHCLAKRAARTCARRARQKATREQ